MILSPTTKNIIIGVGTALILSMLSAMWIGIGKAQAGLNQLGINTQAIQDIGTAMELRGIDRVIESKQKEVRSNDVKIITNPDNKALVDLLNSQNTKLGHEIKAQQVIRECVVDPEKTVCE